MNPAYSFILLLFTLLFGPLTPAQTLDSTALVTQQLQRAVQQGIPNFDFPTQNLHGKSLLFSLELKCEILRVYGNLIRQGLADTTNQALATQLQNQISQLQARELPHLRQEYVRYLSEMLQPLVVKVQLQVDHHTISFTSSLLPTELDKFKLHVALIAVYEALRFKAAIYQAHSTDSITYSISSRPDTDLF